MLPQTRRQEKKCDDFSPGGVFTYGGRSYGNGIFSGVIHEYDMKDGYSSGQLLEWSRHVNLNPKTKLFAGVAKVTTVEHPQKGYFGFWGIELGPFQIGGLGAPQENNWGFFFEYEKGGNAAGAGFYINPAHDWFQMNVPGCRLGRGYR